MAHGISPYHASFSAVETHARGRTMDGEAMQKKVISEVNRSTPEEQNALGFLRCLKPEQHVALERIYNRDTNRSMRAHLRTMQENSFPESRDERIEEARVKAEEAKKTYNDEKGRHTSNGTTIPPDFSVAEANLKNLRRNNPLDETSRTRLENECNKNWATNVGSEDSSKLRAFYESYLNCYDEHKNLQDMSPADFTKEEKQHSLRELNALDKMESKAFENIGKAADTMYGKLTPSEKAAADSYRQKMAGKSEKDEGLREELRNAFKDSDGNASENMEGLKNIFALEDECFSATAKRTEFIGKSKDIHDFLTYQRNLEDKIDGLQACDETRMIGWQKDIDARQTAESSATAKTKEAKSQTTQKYCWMGATATAIVIALGIIAFILNKPPQAAKYPQ
jgi:hypothetical protein